MKRFSRGSSKDLRGDIEHTALRESERSQHRESGRTQNRSSATQSPYDSSHFPSAKSLGKSPPATLNSSSSSRPGELPINRDKLIIREWLDMLTASTAQPGTLAMTTQPPARKKRRFTDHHPDEEVRQYRNASGSMVNGPGASSKSAISIDDSDHDHDQDHDESPTAFRSNRPHNSPPTSPLASLPASNTRKVLAVESDEDGDDSHRSKGGHSRVSPSVFVSPPPPHHRQPHRSPQSSDCDISIDPMDLLSQDDRDGDTPKKILLPPNSPTTSTAASRMAGKKPINSGLGKAVPGSLREAKQASQNAPPKRPVPTHIKPASVSLDLVVIGEYVVEGSLEPRVEFISSESHMTMFWRGESGGPRSITIQASDIAYVKVQIKDQRELPSAFVPLMVLEIDPVSSLAKTLGKEFPGQYDARSRSRSRNIVIRCRCDTQSQSTWLRLVPWLKSSMRTSSGDVDHIDSHGAQAIYNSEIRPVITAWHKRREISKHYLDSKDRDANRRSNGTAASTERPRPRPSLFQPQDPATRSGPIRLEMSTASEGSKQARAQEVPNPPPAQPPRPKPRPASTARDPAAALDPDNESVFDKSTRATRRSVAQGRASLCIPENRRQADSRASSPSPPLNRPKRTTNSLLFDYPFEPPVSVSLFESDCDRLLDGEFLNDTILEFGLKYHLEQIRKRDAALFDSLYVFNSFFYRQLTKSKNRPNEMYQQVRKWTSKTDIFAKRFLVVPINENLHWYLAIVLSPGKALQHVADDEEENGSKGTTASKDDEGSPVEVTKDDEGSITTAQRQESEVQTPTPPPDHNGADRHGQKANSSDADEGNDAEDKQAATAHEPVQSSSLSILDDEAEETANPTFSAFELPGMGRSHGPSRGRSVTGPSRLGRTADDDESDSSVDDPTILSDSILEDLHLNSVGEMRGLHRRHNLPFVSLETSDDDDERVAKELLTGGAALPARVGELAQSAATPQDASTPSDTSSIPSEYEVIDVVSNIKNAGRGRMEGGGPSSSPGSSASAGSPKRRATLIVAGDSMKKYENSAAPPSVSSGSFYATSPSSASRSRPVTAQYGASSRRSGGNLGRGSPQRGATALFAAQRKASGRQSTPVDVDSEPEEAQRRQDTRSTGLNLPFSPSASPPPLLKPKPSAAEETARGDTKAASDDETATPPISKPISDRKSQNIANNRNALQDLCVITFDSLGGSHPSVKTQITHYLRNEAKDKKGLNIDPKVRYLNVAVPEQKNFCDCGLFVLLYFERFFRDVDTFLDRIIPEKDSKNESWQAESAKTARQHWRTLIAELAEQWRERRGASEQDGERSADGEGEGADKGKDKQKDDDQGDADDDFEMVL